MWPTVIEKAIVKVLGGKYTTLNRMIRDSTDFFVELLTGFPVQTMQVQ
jgi:hypothetical protein